jgi:hypothetical protein
LEQKYSENQNLRKQLAEKDLAIEYGRYYLIDITELDDHGLERARDNSVDVISDTDSALETAKKVWDDLVAPWQESTNPVEFRYSNLIRNQYWGPAKKAVQLLIDGTEVKTQDPRRPLVYFHTHYARLREIMVDHARMRGCPVWSLNGYSEWKTADDNLLKSLNKALKLDALADAKKAISHSPEGWAILPERPSIDDEPPRFFRRPFYLSAARSAGASWRR